MIWACEVTILHDANNPWLRRGLGLVAQVIRQGDGGVNDAQALRSLSLLIHPHLPPTLRTLSSSFENIPLYRSEGKEERDARQAMKIVSLEDPPARPAQSPSQAIPVAQAVHMAAADETHVENARHVSYIPAPSLNKENELPTQHPSQRIAGAPAANSDPTTQYTPTSSFNASWTATSLPSASVATPPTFFTSDALVAAGSASMEKKESSLSREVSTRQAQAPPSTFPRQANSQDFGPFDTDGDDDSDDDAPIPEIDMRSDSE